MCIDPAPQRLEGELKCTVRKRQYNACLVQPQSVPRVRLYSSYHGLYSCKCSPVHVLVLKYSKCIGTTVLGNCTGITSLSLAICVAASCSASRFCRERERVRARDRHKHIRDKGTDTHTCTQKDTDTDKQTQQTNNTLVRTKQPTKHSRTHNNETRLLQPKSAQNQVKYS